MPAFSAPAALALITQHRVSALIAVPAMLVDLLAAQHDLDLSAGRRGAGVGSTPGCPSVRRVLLGGGEVPASLTWRARLLFPNAALTAVYGMTEACSSITFQPLGSGHQDWAAGGTDSVGSDGSNAPEGVCMGLPPPGIEVAVLVLGRGGCGDSGACGEEGVAGTSRVADPDGVCRSGHGEVLTRGPHVMLRYWGDPAATSAAFVAPCGCLPAVPAAAPEPRCATCSARASRAAASQDQEGAWALVDAGGSCPESSGEHPPNATSGAAGGADAALDAEHGLVASTSMQGREREPAVLDRRSGSLRPPPGAWLRTGDLGTIDACGRLWLAGRLKDVVRSGGESVNAAEVERVLVRHPAVAAAAVVGLPHARLGEQVAALLVLRAGVSFLTNPGPGVCPDPSTGAAARLGAGALAWTRAQAAGARHAPSPRRSLDTSPRVKASPGPAGAARALTPAGLAAFCRAQGLAGFKVPRVVAVQEGPLPANSAGKVLKAAVRAELLRRVAAPAVPSRM